MRPTITSTSRDGFATSAPRRILTALGVAALASGLLAACGGGDVKPPAAYLRTPAGDFTEAGVGTGCWEDHCVTTSGPVTNAGPVALAARSPLAISFEAGVPPGLQADWYAAGAPPNAADNETLTWPEPGGTPVSEGTVAPGRPGRYLLLVRAQWEKGDLEYGFYVEIS